MSVALFDKLFILFYLVLFYFILLFWFIGNILLKAFVYKAL